MLKPVEMLKEWMSRSRKPVPRKLVVKNRYHLTTREAENMEKALKFYLFCRQKGKAQAPKAIKERLQHAGHVAFSMIKTFLEEQEFKLEYMEFLNGEWKELLHKEAEIGSLPIPPSEIDNIELQKQARFRFSDVESGRSYHLCYNKNKKVCKVKIYGK